ncbi:hypothetical protein L9F63_001230, partial [Diploptera punctata]
AVPSISVRQPASRLCRPADTRTLSSDRRCKLGCHCLRKILESLEEVGVVHGSIVDDEGADIVVIKAGMN